MDLERMPVSQGSERRGAMSDAELEELRSALLERREQLLRASGALSREALKPKDPSAPIHPADAAMDTHLREVALGLLESERRELEEISGALGRLRDGTFGICRTCGNPIGLERLRAIPYAALCLECKMREERGSGSATE